MSVGTTKQLGRRVMFVMFHRTTRHQPIYPVAYYETCDLDLLCLQSHRFEQRLVDHEYKTFIWQNAHLT